ncbi:hypothetical protein L209DRAFT_754886 [Thermothelomyces heterothallicus CBS 203.75]
MGYGSGTADFPYLVSPAAALLAQAEPDNSNVIFDATTPNWDLATMQQLGDHGSGKDFLSLWAPT